MARKTNRREFVQVAGLAASGLVVATGGSLAGATPEPQARAAAQARLAPGTMGARFRALMNGPEPLICPGAYDVLTARLIALHGFKGAFIGSSVINQALVALPDHHDPVRLRVDSRYFRDLRNAPLAAREPVNMDNQVQR